MSNRKKKKTPPKPPTDHGVTKDYFDQFSITARKVLQVLELDPALFDEFTKNQKKQMMLVKFLPPKVIAKSGNSIPRQYIKIVQQEGYEYLKRTFVGDKSIGLSYLDFSSMGMAFIMYFGSEAIVMEKEPDNKTSIAIGRQIDKYINAGINDNLMFNYCTYVHYILVGISKISIRIYGFDWKWKPVANSNRFAAHVLLTSSKAESINYLYNGAQRPAYRVFMGELVSDAPIYLKAPFNKIIKSSMHTYTVDLYIQNHALNRLKERLDTLSAFNRNIYLLHSLMTCNTIKLETGKFVFKFENIAGQLLGYLPFTIIDRSLIVLSFIPLSSPAMPEGKLLCEALNTEKNDLVFLGMDKLSFYQNTDFEIVPHLRDALKKADMWHLTEVKPEENFDELLYGQNSSSINRFFQQNAPEPNKEEVFDEIEKMY